MNRGPLLFLGVFFALASSWYGMVLKPHLQIGSLQQTNTVATAETYPAARPGLARQGAEVYRANGCVYCHTQSVRALDWDMGSERIAQSGDYIADEPIQLGSQRTGVDLSQEGGEHPDDWHHAHFVNPRYTRPSSIMPPFQWLGMERIEALTRYVQSLGLKDADRRMEDAVVLLGSATPSAGRMSNTGSPGKMVIPTSRDWLRS